MFLESSLLKFVLLRWCPDAASMLRILQFAVILGADIQTVFFCARNVPSGMPVASTSAPGGSSNDLGALGSARKETLGSRLGFLFRWVEFGTAFSIFLVTLQQHMCFL